MVTRTDAGGATHDFIGDCRSARIAFSVGSELTSSATGGGRCWRPRLSESAAASPRNLDRLRSARPPGGRR